MSKLGAGTAPHLFLTCCAGENPKEGKSEKPSHEELIVIASREIVKIRKRFVHHLPHILTDQAMMKKFFFHLPIQSALPKKKLQGK